MLRSMGHGSVHLHLNKIVHFISFIICLNTITLSVKVQFQYVSIVLSHAQKNSRLLLQVKLSNLIEKMNLL